MTSRFGLAVAGAGAAVGLDVGLGSTVVTVGATSFTAAVEVRSDAFGVEAGRAVAVGLVVGSAERVFVVGDVVRVGVGLGTAVLVTLAIVVTTGSGGSVETGGANALVGAALGVGARVATVVVADGVWTRGRVATSLLGGVGDGVAGDVAGVAVAVVGGMTLAAGPGGDGVPAALTTVDAPAGTVTVVPPAFVSTLPAVATTVVSPSGKTATNEPDPARMTEAMAALRTSYRPPEATVLVTAYQTRPRVCCIRTT